MGGAWVCTAAPRTRTRNALVCDLATRCARSRLEPSSPRVRRACGARRLRRWYVDHHPSHGSCAPNHTCAREGPTPYETPRCDFDLNSACLASYCGCPTRRRRDATTKMLPPKVDATLTVAHAKAIQEHKNAHHRASQDHRLAQERCELLEEENKELRAADARREKALQDALRLLCVATRGKQEAQREATRHKREMRRAATRRMIARGPALPSAVQERLRVMQARVEALETQLQRKDRRCAFLERCLERCKGGASAIKAVEESDRAKRLAAELDAAMRQLEDRSALAPPPPPPTPSPRRRAARPRTPRHDSRNTLCAAAQVGAKCRPGARLVAGAQSPARPVPASPAALARRAALRPPSSPSSSPRSVARTPVRTLEEPSPAGMSLSLEEIAGL